MPWPGRDGTDRRFAIAAWLVPLGLIIPFAAGGIALFERFDGLYGQDPFAYFDYAMGPVRQSLLDLRPPPPFFWPPGYPIAVALASLPLGVSPLVAQLVSLVAGALVPVFTVLLAREIWPSARAGSHVLVPAGSALSDTSSNTEVAVLAGLLVALTGQLWQSSVVVMADTLGLALATAGIWALARYGRRGHRPGWLLLAAMLMAAATLTRWIYGLVGIPCVVFALHALARHPRRAEAFAHAGAAALVTGIFLGPVLVGAADEAVRSGGGIAPFAGNFQVYRWSPGWALGREFVTPDGRLSYETPTGLYYALAPARWAYFTPIIAPFILPGVWVVLRRRAAAPLVLLLGWAAVVLAFHAGSAYQNFRFTLAFLPPLAILAAIGVRQVAGALPRATLPAAAGAMAIGLALMAAAGLHTTRTLIAYKHRTLEVVRWTETRTPADARLLTFDLTSTFRRYSHLQTLELYDQDPDRLDGLVTSGAPVFLLVDTAHVARQWADQSPGRNVRWLERGPGLTGLGDEHGFTLFAVGARASPEGATEP
jgi:hypothetical protein